MRVPRHSKWLNPESFQGLRPYILARALPLDHTRHPKRAPGPHPKSNCVKIIFSCTKSYLLTLSFNNLHSTCSYLHAVYLNFVNNHWNKQRNKWARQQKKKQKQKQRKEKKTNKQQTNRKPCALGADDADVWMMFFLLCALLSDACLFRFDANLIVSFVQFRFA